MWGYLFLNQLDIAPGYDPPIVITHYIGDIEETKLAKSARA